MSTTEPGRIYSITQHGADEDSRTDIIMDDRTRIIIDRDGIAILTPYGTEIADIKRRPIPATSKLNPLGERINIARRATTQKD